MIALRGTFCGSGKANWAAIAAASLVERKSPAIEVAGLPSGKAVPVYASHRQRRPAFPPWAACARKETPHEAAETLRPDDLVAARSNSFLRRRRARPATIRC